MSITSRLLIALLLAILMTGCGKEPRPQGEQPAGGGIGLFSVSNTRQVEFAPGNLAEDGRSFVAHQWDLGGYFGWGTGNHPSDTSEDYQDYITFDDWGNHIEGGWRTLTYDEWRYIVFERDSARLKVAVGLIIGVEDTMDGLILLPDSWTLPDSCEFWPGMYAYERNQYSLRQWQKMEEAGAVFLRVGGYRWGAEIIVQDHWGLSHGNYWLSTQYDENDAYYIYFIANLENLLPIPITNPAAGMQVRLVRERN